MARLAEGALERLLHPLASERHQPELVNRKDAGGGAVVAQGFLQRLDHFLAVAALVHVDEVDHDDPAQVAQADLAHNFLHRVDIGLDDGVFQAIGLAHVLARVDVDRHQRFGLVDDDKASRLEPDLGPQRFVDFGLDAKFLKEGRLAVPELHVPYQGGLGAAHKIENTLVLGFVIDPN